MTLGGPAAGAGNGWRCRKVATNGIHWPYLVEGRGPEGVLVLPGVLGGNQLLRKISPRLRDRYKLIQPDYPALMSLDSMVSGILTILDREKIERTAAVGASFGGFLIQSLLRRDPGRFTRVVVAESRAPTPAKTRNHRRALLMASFLPPVFVRVMLRRVFRRMISGMDSDLRRRVWIRYYDRLVRQVDRRVVKSRYSIMLDYDGGPSLTRAELRRWGGEVLLLEASDDEMADRQDAETLRRLHPDAQIYTFEGIGHGAAYLRPFEWADVVVDFLDRAERAVARGGSYGQDLPHKVAAAAMQRLSHRSEQQ